MLLIIFKSLINRVAIIILLAFFMSKIGLFRKLISKQDINVKDKILLSFIFGIYGIIGTYTGIPISGAIANARVVGVFVGGLLGGPFVGVLSGIIAGGHRYLIDIGGFTAFACALSTLMEGIMAGFLKKRMEKYEDKLAFSLITGMAAEVLQMIIILIFAKPFSKALSLVKIIGIPMIITNGIGIAVFIAITDSIFKDLETAAAYQAQLALRIANKTLKYFRKGFNETTAYETATIIKEMTNVKAVSFSNREEILAHVGVGEDHHFPGSPIKTNLTRETIKKGKYSVANFQNEIGCENENCSLKSAIIVPLTEGNKVIGTLKLYKTEENSITKVEKELALGLAQIFSTQIELSKVDFQREMLVKSELKALQAQINPHFLFNAINTIVSLIRTQPDNARNLLIHLGNYFRNNLQEGNDEVELHKEIENINSYLEIEKARFGDKLKIIYNIPEEIDCLLPPLLLQPIVENAVKHGVLEKIEGGTVEITAIDNEIETELIVKDDGVGMSPETLSSLFNEDNNSDSIGLNNVNSRLKNKYGKEYSLKIDSKLNKGTIVTMTIPKKQRGKVV
ncbi:sensor histidine kinase [Anaerosalibacter bizertensis]|uniref:histidine kinase n=2 Tax=Anaerosalibacter bizertensis TaxID=932217 RepID=A0A9Q4AAG1_9FIRM|nr:sensor histidine kinase [Anaerosalibacter bizertensis]MBV1816490.1 sensor histidine kinase [Bacteroidales bacterium MSK.15.36]MCB5558550.1 sensor histidine kinase [Anaerosalibacter bizertensis]MCG4563879.1 sensor histidine kinase [Anaerosalibacter bizertensis]MCG4581467.1 sensor histidine kinase [Anaerosalibacter bizertensis]